MMTMILMVITTLMVSNEFRTDTEFSSVSPPDNFSQIIFASAHSFIMEKISPFGYHCQCHHEIPINHEAYSYILFEFWIWNNIVCHDITIYPPPQLISDSFKADTINKSYLNKSKNINQVGVVLTNQRSSWKRSEEKHRATSLARNQAALALCSQTKPGCNVFTNQRSSCFRAFNVW